MYFLLLLAAVLAPFFQNSILEQAGSVNIVIPFLILISLDRDFFRNFLVCLILAFLSYLLSGFLGIFFFYIFAFLVSWFLFNRVLKEESLINLFLVLFLVCLAFAAFSLLPVFVINSRVVSDFLLFFCLELVITAVFLFLFKPLNRNYLK